MALFENKPAAEIDPFTDLLFNALMTFYFSFLDNPSPAQSAS